MNFLEASLVMEDQLQEEGWTREQYTRPVWREWIYRPTALTPVCKIHEFDKEKKSFYISDMMTGYLRVTHATAELAELVAAAAERAATWAVAEWVAAQWGAAQWSATRAEVEWARKSGRADNIWTNSYEELTEIK